MKTAIRRNRCIINDLWAMAGVGVLRLPHRNEPLLKTWIGFLNLFPVHF